MKTSARCAALLTFILLSLAKAAPPAKPQNVQQAWLGSESILLWDDVTGTTSYNIYRADETNTWSFVGSSTVPRFRDPAWQLLPSFYLVTAVNADGESVSSDLSTVSYHDPYLVTHSQPQWWDGTLTPTNAIIQWYTDDPNGSQGIVDWGLDSTNFSFFAINTNYLPSQRFDLTNLTPLTVYYYRLTSINSNRSGVIYLGSFGTPDTNHPPVAFDLTYPWLISTNGLWIVLHGYDSNDPQHALSFRVVSQPTNGTLSAFQLEWGWGENMIHYTPNLSARGYDHFQFVVNNGTWDSAPALVTLTNWINTPPVVTNGYVTTPEDTPIALTLPTFDAQGDPITFTIPSWATYRGSVTGQPPNMVFIPETNMNGTAWFSYLVTDGYQEVNGWFQIEVTPVNDKPVLMTNAFMAPVTWEDTPKTIGLWVYDVEGAWPYEYIVVTPPAHGTLGEPVWDNITYTPATNFYGVDSFTMVAREPDGTTSDPQTYWITVSPMNDMPVGIDQDVIVLEDASVVITPTGMDVDSDPALFTFEVAWGGWPTNGWLEGTGTNFIYHPRPDFFGTDAFQFNVIDDWGYRSWERPGTVRITVLPVGEAPVASITSAYAHQDAFVNAYFWVSDVDSDTLVCEVVDPPVNGMVTVSGTNFLYRPSAGYQGSDFFTYRVFDGEFYSAITNVYVWVSGPNNPPQATPQTISSVQNTPVAASLLASDPDWDLLTAVLIDPPQHGTIEFSRYNMVEGIIATYTPTNDFLGTDSFTYRASDGVTNTSNTLVTINVAPPNEAPVAFSTNLMTQRDTPLNFALLVTDADGDTLTYIVGSPTNGTLSGTAPNLTYTPNAGFMGADSFTFRANDGTVNGNTATVIITTTRPNVAPTATSQSVTTAEDTSLVITLSGSDGDGDALTFRILSGPLHGTLTGTSPNLTYRPAINYNGSDSFTFTVNDGIVDGNTATVSLTITPVNDAPILLNPTTVQTLPEEWVTAWNPLATDPDGDPITYRLVTPPSHGTYDITNHLYRAAKDYNGGDYFTWVANDGQMDSALGTFSISITPLNDAPVASNQTVTVNTDISTIITPLVGDVDNASLTLTVLTQPQHGTVTVNGMTFSYQPVSGYTGSDSFTYRASDGLLNSSNATISINVVPMNTPPVRVSPDRSFTISEDWYREFDTQASDTDGDALTYRIVTPPTHGTLMKLTSNTWRYQPNWNWFGSDMLTWVANDGQVDSTIGTVWFNVTSENDRPLTGYDSLTNAEDTAFAVTLWASDVEGSPLTYTLLTLPTNGVLSGTGSNRIYTPNPNFVGGDSLTYKVNDGQLDSSFPGTILFTVTNVNDAPVANSSAITTAEDTAASITLTGSDVESVVSFSIVSGPAHGVLSGTPPNLIYTPNANFNGADSFVFSVSDGLTNNSATVSISVTAITDLPAPENLRRRFYIPQGAWPPPDFNVHLWWHAVAGADSYNIYRADGTNAPLTLLPSGIATTNYVDTTSESGHFYTYSVTAVNAFDEGAPATVTTLLSGGCLVEVNEGNWGLWAARAHVIFCNNCVIGSEGQFDWGLTTNYTFSVDNTNLLGCHHVLVSNLQPDTVYYYRLTSTDSNGVALVHEDSFVTASAPFGNPQDISVNEDNPVDITLTGQDPAPQGFLSTLTYSIVSGVSHGTLVAVNADTYRYTPATNYNGTDSFTFKVNNGELDSAPATVSLTVNAVNDLPVVANISRTTAEDTVATIPASFTDIDGGPTVLVQIVSQPAHGSAGASGTNLFYLPATNYSGADTFTYRVSDGYGFGNTATVFLTVTNVEDSPIAFPQSVTATEDVNKAITLVGVDPDGDAITFSVFTSPSHGTLTGTAPNVTYRPTTNYNGSDSFTFRTYDGKSFSAPATVSITVTPVNDPPIVSNIVVTIAEDTAVMIPPAYFDVEGFVAIGPPVQLVSLPTHGTAWSDGMNMFYQPATNYAGADSFTYRVTDGQAYGNTATVSITVSPIDDVPVAHAQSVTTAEDQSVAITLSGSDVEGSSLYYMVPGYPAHGSLSGIQANLVYTPNPHYYGTDTITFKVFDGVNQSAEATVTITITPVPDAPVVSSRSFTTPEDTALPITLPASDWDLDPLTISIVDAPAHGVVTGTGRDVVYTPNPNFNGSDSFTFKANDGTFDSNLGTISINVTSVADVPVATGTNVSTIEDSPIAIVLSATDADGDTLTYSIQSSPTHGTLTGTGANVIYTPAANYNGSDSFTFRANDGTANSAAATVSITVTAVNDAPVAVNRSFTLNEDYILLSGVSATDPDGDALTYRIVTPPLGTLSFSPNGNFSYRGPTNYNGTDSFTFVANDGTTDGNIATVTITLLPMNDTPSVTNQMVSTLEDTALAITPAASDIDGDTLTFTIVDNADHGSVAWNGTQFIYTPATNYTGLDAFGYHVEDPAGGGNYASITINVQAVNDAPIAQSRAISTAEDTAVAATLIGTDVDGDVLTYRIITAPTNGVLSGSGPNRVYTPNPNVSGTDSFTYTVNDGTVDANIATITLTITAVNDWPVANPQSVSLNEDGSLPITLTGSDVEGSPLTFQIAGNPTHGWLTGTPPNVTYNAYPNYNGPDSFVFVASDGNMPSFGATVSISITPVPDAPIANSQLLNISEDTSVAITLTAVDYDGDPLTYSIVSGPVHGTLTGTPPNLTYTPPANLYGTDSFTFVASDGTLSSSTKTVNINIAAVNDAPVANAQSVTVTYNTAKTVTLTGSDVEGSGLTYSVVTGPTNGTLSGTAPNLTYTPAVGSAGADFFTFRANDGSSNSAPATVSITTLNPTGIPSTPSGLGVTVPTAIGTLILNWNCSATNEDGFKIERSLNSGSGWSEIATTGINIHTFTNMGLTSGTRYYYRVRSYNRLGNSAYSNTKDARPR